MVIRRSRFVSRTRGARRETDWFSIAVTSSQVANSATLVSSLNAAALALRPFTIIRTHLQITATSDQSAASESYFAALGAAVVSDPAAAIGVTAVPTPETDRESDLFFLYQDILGDFSFGSNIGFIGNEMVQYSLDSKAMRKVSADEDVVFVVEGGTVIGEGSLISFSGRMLVKLH